MKRIIASLLLVALLITGLVGTLTSCQPGGGNGGNNASQDFEIPAEGFDTQTPVTIRFYHSMGAALQEILNETITEFNKLYPNITIEHESYGDYDGVRNQIQTEVTVGNQPHIAYCYPDHIAVYNEAGAVQTLDSLINSTVTVNRADGTTETIGYTQAQLDDFIQGYYNEGKAFGDGKMYLSITSDPYGATAYAGGEYRTKEFYGYGMYDVSMKPIKNDGVVSSFFTYTGPTDGNQWDEIDIEFLGKNTKRVQFNYYVDNEPDKGHEFMYNLPFDYSEDYHKYGLLTIRDK